MGHRHRFIARSEVLTTSQLERSFSLPWTKNLPERGQSDKDLEGIMHMLSR